MKTKKLRNMGIELQKEPPKISVPDELPPLPGLFGFFGVRGSGKTTAAQSLLRKYKAAGLMHRLFLITPTYESNRFLFDGLLQDTGDVFESTTQASLDEVINRVHAEAEEWRIYKSNKKLWHEFQLQKKEYVRGKRKEIDPELVGEVMQAGLGDLDTFPDYKYGDCDHPCMWLVLDDIQSSSLLNQSTKVPGNLANLCIKHRHIAGRFGVNIIMCFQNWKMQVGALSRALRANLTACALFGYRDKKIVDSIYEEVSQEVSLEVFQQCYDYATQPNKWDFLFVEFGSDVRLRKNLDELIIFSGQDNGPGTDKGAGEVG